MAFDRSAEGHREIRSQRSAVSGAVGRGRIKLTGSPYAGSFVCAEAASPLEWDAAFCRKLGWPQQKGRLGDLPMPDKTSGRPRKRATKGESSRTASVSAAAEKADQYIADQLKAMYGAVVVEPVPDRLLQLLDRLDNEEEE